MSEKTAIAWCDSTLNFWEGCTKISEGCANCYAATRDQRFHRGKHWGPCAPRLNHVVSATKKVLAWNKQGAVCDTCGTHITQRADAFDCECGAATIVGTHRRRVFLGSLMDWLDPEVPATWLAAALDDVRRCPELDFLLLSKRLESWRTRLEDVIAVSEIPEAKTWASEWLCGTRIPQNIWLGTTVENQAMADKRIPELLRIPAKVRFLSVEPLLKPIALQCALPSSLSDADDQFVDWVIVGGESGHKARPCNVEWIRSIVKQCAEASVNCFVKQMGRKPILPDGTTVWLCDRAGADPAEWPADLRVQQFPHVPR